MHRDPKPGQGPAASKSARGLPGWFKLAVMVLLGLIIMKATGLEVFIEVTYDGIPFIGALTDVRIYFVPLLLVLIFILLSWIWRKFFGSSDS